jgi:hypothetical protein
MKLAHTTPCSECPWRRKHPAGWLGGYPATDFINQVQFDGPPVPCHKTIPGDGTDARAMCAGALIFMKNCIKSAQHPDYGDALDQVEADTENVFQWSHEFLHHHSEEGQQEWFDRIRAKISEEGPDDAAG